MFVWCTNLFFQEPNHRKEHSEQFLLEPRSLLFYLHPIEYPPFHSEGFFIAFFPLFSIPTRSFLRVFYFLIHPLFFGAQYVRTTHPSHS